MTTMADLVAAEQRSGHHVEQFIGDDSDVIGWHCLTCNAQQGYPRRLTTWTVVADGELAHHREVTP